MQNIPYCNYTISKTKQSYCDNNMIGLYVPPNHDLTDSELNTFITDTITHEFIHHVLEHLFSEVVTYLFDCIGDKLRNNNLSLLKRVVASDRKKYTTSRSLLWCDVIAQQGVQGLINAYDLDYELVKAVLIKGC